jgi:hypothetical protein
MRIISLEELVTLIPEITVGDEFYERYLSWGWLSEEDENKLQFLGFLAYTGSREEYPSEYGYWMPEYPIALHCYPNNDCEIYQYREGIFLVYEENLGRPPDKWCRLVQRELIVEE